MALNNPKTLGWILLVIILSLVPVGVLAAEQAEVIPQQPIELPSMAGYFIRVFFSLILIIILTYVVIKMIKKQNDIQQRQKEWIKIIDYQALGSNRGIYLVEILAVVYILGVSEGQLSILKEIDPQDDNWLVMREHIEHQETLPMGLDRMLKDGLRRFKSSGGSDTVRFKDQLEQQLNRSQRLYRKFTGGEGDGKK